MSPHVDEVFSVFSQSSQSSSNLRRYNILYKGWERVARSLDIREILTALTSELHFSVAVHARRMLFVHAGVVGWNNQAIVIPGSTMSGKTTLVQSLVQAGATYYSDEYAVFDPQGRVHPYPKPLSIRTEGGKHPELHTAESLGGKVGHKPLHVGMVVVSQYHPDSIWLPNVLSPGQAALALLSNTVVARAKPDLALSIFRRVVPNVLTLQGKRGAAEKTALDLLARVCQQI